MVRNGRQAFFAYGKFISCFHRAMLPSNVVADADIILSLVAVMAGRGGPSSDRLVRRAHGPVNRRLIERDDDHGL